MSQQPWDAMPGWLQQVSGLIGAGGLSVIVLKVVERVFARDDRQAADRVSISSELRQEVRELRADVERQAERNNELVAMNAELRGENLALRSRYHQVLNVVGVLAARDATYRDRLGLPPDEINLPAWIYQPVEGPTARAAGPQPTEPRT